MAEVAELIAILTMLCTLNTDDPLSTVTPSVIWNTEGHPRILGNRWDDIAIGFSRRPPNSYYKWDSWYRFLLDVVYSRARSLELLLKASYRERMVIDIHLHKSPKITEGAAVLVDCRFTKGIEEEVLKLEMLHLISMLYLTSKRPWRSGYWK